MSDEELLEVEQEQEMSREEAAKLLHRIADVLARNNEVAFEREGLRYRVKVPNQVEVSVEIEVTDEGGELEVEISW